MKRDKLVIYLSELLLLIYIIMFKNIILVYFNSYIDIVNILFLGILLFIVNILLGFPRNKKLINYNAIQTVVICFIIYYFLTYLFGMFFGFLSNSYSLKLIKIFANVVVALLLYIFKEVYRYIIIKKSNKNMFSIVMVTLIMAFLNIIMEINAYDLKNGVELFEFIEASLLPNLALSALLSYISYNFNYKVALLFLILYDLPKYFLPLFPDMGVYIGSVVDLIFIFVCYYQLSIILEKVERKIVIFHDYGKGQLSVFLVVIPLLILIGLTSGIFKYHLFAIGSNSMLPYFSKGDAVLIEKIESDEIDKIAVGDVIAFNYNRQIIVHRVVSIEFVNGNYQIKTKGDNNDSIDAWIVDSNNLYGKMNAVIKYIGIPSVELSELMD